MKRIATAVLAADALTLAGCSGTGESGTESAVESTTQTSTTTESETNLAKVGDTIPVNCTGSSCTGEVKVEEIAFGGECEIQLVAEEIPEGMQLVQLKGILTAVEKVTDSGGAEIGVVPETPVAWDSEKFKTSAEWGGGCDIPQGYEQWGGFPANHDEKVRVYGSYLIPEDTHLLGIANSKFDLADIEPATAPASSSVPPSSVVQQPATQQQAPAQQPTSVAPAPVQQEEETVIGYTEAPGQEEPHQLEKQIASCGDPSIHETGTTFFTDGTSGWTANCAAQMM